MLLLLPTKVVVEEEEAFAVDRNPIQRKQTKIVWNGEGSAEAGRGRALQDGEGEAPDGGDGERGGRTRMRRGQRRTAASVLLGRRRRRRSYRSREPVKMWKRRSRTARCCCPIRRVWVEAAGRLGCSVETV